MTWIVVIGLALAAFAIAAFVLQLPRQVWTVLGSALVLGLLGYSLQGSPDLPARPAPGAAGQQAETGGQLVELRRDLLAERYWTRADVRITADGMLRNGRPEYAAGLWRGAAEDNPQMAEPWLALGIALVAQSDGFLTPAAQLAFTRAEQAAPEDPAVPFFLGLAEIRGQDLQQARALWAEAQARAEEGGEARLLLDQRIAQLDAIIAQAGGQPPQAPSAPSGQP